MLAELEELGMQLARAAAARALADLAEPEAPEEVQEAAPHPEHLAQEPPSEAAQAPTPRSASARAPSAGTRKSADPVQSFLRLASAICACIALEARLTAGPATGSRLVPPALRADPRREPLLKAFRDATEHTMDRALMRYEFAFRLDHELTADPEQILGLPELFFPLCEDLKIKLDHNKLPDAILGMDPNRNYDDVVESPEDDPFVHPIPDPCATSPP